MAQFANQYEPEQPSMASSLFGSPMRAQWTLQKGSMMMTMMSNSMWKQALSGNGIKWSGIVGFRGLALGQNALRKGAAGILSPLHAIAGITNAFSRDLGDRLSAGGLFGKGGVLNKSGKNAVFNTMGKIFGGGAYGAMDLPGATALTNVISVNTAGEAVVGSNVFEKFLSQAGLSKEAYKKAVVSGNKNILAGIYGTRAQSGMKSFFKSKVSSAKWYADKVRSFATKAERSYGLPALVTPSPGVMSQSEQSLVRDIVMKDFKKGALVRSVARIGRFATFAAAATIAYDIGSFLGGFAMDTIGNAADKLESQLKSISNRQMEFGGKVGVGFYSGASGTERQRALSAIGRGGGSAPGMGNEAGFQHVDSTW